MSKVAAIITAGGIGSRTGLEIPKQFVVVEGKPIIIHTLENFENHKEIEIICVPCLSGWEEKLENYAKEFHISKLKRIVQGGETGFLSIRNALFALESDLSDDDIVMIHDGIRPLVSSELISENLRMCKEKGNAICAIESVEALLKLEEPTMMCSKISLDRSLIKREQTPQSTSFKELLQLHKEAKKRGIIDSVTLSTLLTTFGRKVFITKGDEGNIKITHTQDIEMFHAILLLRGQVKHQQSCPTCASSHLNPVLTLENIAASANVAYHSADEAKRAPKGNLRLIQCQKCGFMWNVAFDIELLAYNHYAFSYKYSPAFHKHLDFLIAHLQKNYQIHNAKMIEIGCGEAHALYTIAKATDSKGIGYEPSFAERKLDLPSDFGDYVEVVIAYYNESALHKDADMILCRHVLEHIPEPLSFLQSINQTLRTGGKNPLVVFEVPRLENSLSREFHYQFIYEHCNYFSPKSLVKIFEKAGFKVLETFRCFENGAFQLIFACLKDSDSKDYSCEDKSLFTKNVFDFKTLHAYCQRLESFEKVAIWCAGNSSQILYHLLNNPKQICCFIDLNPEKQGNFMAVSGLPILSPEQAIKKGITAVIVGNATFEKEVAKMILENEYPLEVIG